MNKRKMAEIQQAIHELMLSNKLNKSISNSRKLDEIKESEKFFIYCEVINTKPQLSYVFNADEVISLGRLTGANQICIQDMNVSRMQCKFFMWEWRLYVQNISERVPIYIKRKRNEYELWQKDMMEILQGDVVYIGQMKLKLLLIQGTEQIVN